MKLKALKDHVIVQMPIKEDKPSLLDIKDDSIQENNEAEVHTSGVEGIEERDLVIFGPKYDLIGGSDSFNYAVMHRVNVRAVKEI